MSSIAALRKLAEIDNRRYRAILEDLAPWETTAGTYTRPVPYPMRRASWRLLKLAGAL